MNKKLEKILNTGKVDNMFDAYGKRIMHDIIFTISSIILGGFGLVCIVAFCTANPGFGLLFSGLLLTIFGVYYKNLLLSYINRNKSLFESRVVQSGDRYIVQYKNNHKIFAKWVSLGCRYSSFADQSQAKDICWMIQDFSDYNKAVDYINSYKSNEDNLSSEDKIIYTGDQKRRVY